MTKKDDEIATYLFLRRYYFTIWQAPMPVWNDLTFEQRQWLAIEYSKMHSKFAAKLTVAADAYQRENSK